MFWLLLTFLLGVVVGALVTGIITHYELDRRLRRDEEARLAQPPAAHAPPRQVVGTVIVDEVHNSRGYCGVLGCRNKRPHSHVEDLARRIRGK